MHVFSAQMNTNSVGKTHTLSMTYTHTYTRAQYMYTAYDPIFECKRLVFEVMRISMFIHTCVCWFTHMLADLLCLSMQVHTYMWRLVNTHACWCVVFDYPCAYIHVKDGLCTCVPIHTTKCQHAHTDNIDPERNNISNKLYFLIKNQHISPKRTRTNKILNSF